MERELPQDPPYPANIPPLQQEAPRVRRASRLELPHYDKTRDPTRFLQIYEEACEVFGETGEQDKMKLFSMMLYGLAKDWYYNLDPAERMDWTTLKTAFIKRFKSMKFSDSPFTQISHIKMGKKEKVRDYVERLKRLKTECPLELAHEHAVVNWFMYGLPSRIRKQMRSIDQYHTLREAVEDAIREEDELSDEGSDHEPKVVRTSLYPARSDAVSSRDANEVYLNSKIEEIKQGYQSEIDKLTKRLKELETSAVDRASYPRAGVWCTICHNPHTANECPLNKGYLSQGPPKCVFYNEVTYQSFHCQFNPQNQKYGPPRYQPYQGQGQHPQVGYQRPMLPAPPQRLALPSPQQDNQPRGGGIIRPPPGVYHAPPPVHYTTVL